ncbi:MAG: hypothetical protein ACE5J9_04005, partial [Methanosarcinales archaeon]
RKLVSRTFGMYLASSLELLKDLKIGQKSMTIIYMAYPSMERGKDNNMNANCLFLDTAYVLALLNPKDAHHEQAKAFLPILYALSKDEILEGIEGKLNERIFRVYEQHDRFSLLCAQRCTFQIWTQ